MLNSPLPALQGVVEEASHGPAKINDAAKLATIVARRVCDAEDMMLLVYVKRGLPATQVSTAGGLPFGLRNSDAIGSVLNFRTSKSQRR